MNNSTLSVGDVVEVRTERLAFGGEAVARHNGVAIFIPLAAPQERLSVRITERKKTYARALIQSVLEPSPLRREPACRYFGECGGCQLQHISYEAQLEAKVGFIRDALERIGRVDWPHEINIRSASEFGYRSRAQVKVDWRRRRVGFNQPNSNAVCDVESCPILVPELNAALHSIRGILGDAPERNYKRLHYGTQIEMASGDSTVSFEPSLTGESADPLQRTIQGALYSFHPATFFQGNSGLIDQLVDEAVGGEAGDVAIDLYAGVGLFTIQLASRFNRVIGIEANQTAAKFAAENIKVNGVTNVEFHNITVEAWLKSFVEARLPEPDLMILDPPRRGAPEAVAQAAALKPSRITYVSCDPTTLARDLRTLLDSGYELKRITAIDLFPQTYHIETVAALVRG